MIALLSEIDPSKQPEQLTSQQSDVINPYHAEEESESEEEDIFGQITGISNKKQKYSPFKSLSPEIKQAPEPLKHMMLLKLVQFNELGIKRKD